MKEIKSVSVFKFKCVKRPSLKFRQAEQFPYILSLPVSSSVQLSIYYVKNDPLVLRLLSRGVRGKCCLPSQGGKLIWGLAHLVKQLGLQNHLNAKVPVCRCLDMRNNMRVRIYVLAECVSRHVG